MATPGARLKECVREECVCVRGSDFAELGCSGRATSQHSGCVVWMDVT